MQEEQIDRIVDPGDFITGERRLAVVDFGSTEVGDYRRALQPPAHSLASQRRVDVAEIHCQQIRRAFVQREAKALRLDQAAFEQGLVVARDEAFFLTALADDDMG